MPDTASPTTIIVADKDLRVTRVSDSSGFGADSAAGEEDDPGYGSLLDYLGDFERPEAEEICGTILAGGKFAGGARSYRRVITEREVLGDRWIVLIGPRLDRDGAVDGIVYAKFHSSDSDEIPQRDLDPDKFYEFLVENSTQLVYLLNPQGILTFINRCIEEISGQPASEFTGKHFSEIIHPDDVEWCRETFETVMAAGAAPLNHSYRIARPDGSARHITLNASLIRSEIGDRLLCIGRDITEAVELREDLIARNKALSALSTMVVALYQAERTKSLELDALAREAHHRIKNNLQMITGLLAIACGEGENGRRAAPRCLRQVRAIATVHDLLNPKSKESRLGLKDCLTSVAQNALDAAGCGNRIELTVDGDDRLVSSDQATALSIIVNELIFNAVEHAFGDGRAGSIRASIDNSGSRTIVTVDDNGAGLPPGFAISESSDSGLGLASSLAVYGLGGSIDLENIGVGTRVSITF